MSSGYEVEVTVSSAKDLKNVNWRYGPNKPYAVVWVESARKVSSRVDEEGDTSPTWDQTLVIPLDRPIDDATLYIDIVHAHAEEDTKPLIGSAKLPLREVVDKVGMGSRHQLKLKLKRPSGRPHGKLDVQVSVRQCGGGYPAPDSYGASSYGTKRDVDGYGGGSYYGSVAPPPVGYPAYTHQQQGYGQPEGGYGQGPPAGGYGYGYGQEVEEKKKSGFGGMGMGAGLAIGAAAGVVGGIALTQGYEHWKDGITEDAAEQAREEMAEEEEKEEDADDYDDDDE